MSSLAVTIGPLYAVERACPRLDGDGRGSERAEALQAPAALRKRARGADRRGDPGVGA